MNKQLNLLQIYRGVAAILVVLAHGIMIVPYKMHQDSVWNVFHFGWIGVDFFFVLSGFIIFYIHQSDIGQPSKFKSFIVKRILRVYPLYWIILTCKIVVSLLSKSGNDGDRFNLAELVKAFLLLPQDRDILERFFIGVSWTLNHEIFFYAIFSIMILLKPKFSIPLSLFWVLGSIANIANLIQLPQENFLIQFILNERNLEFVLGCLAAYTVAKFKKFNQESLLISISLFLLIASVINTKKLEYNVLEISPVITYGIPFTLLIIASVFLEQRKKLSIPFILTYIGNSSYSIYLTHGFLLKNITNIVSNLNLSVFVNSNLYFSIMYSIIITLVLTIGCLIHTYLEKPLVARLRISMKEKLA